MTIIKTKEFILRHATMKDTKAYLEIHKDKEAKKNFMRIPKNLAEARKELEESLNKMRKKKEEMLAVVVNGEVAGFVWLSELNKKRHEHQGSIGYGLIKRFRGRGIGSAAIKLVTNYAFKKYKLKRMATFTRTFNKASARVLEKAGYKLEGIMRKNKKKNGKYLDDMIWAKVK